MKRVILLAFILTLAMAASAAAQTPGWMNHALRPSERATLLDAAMTLDEKIEQIALNTGPNPDLPRCGQRNDSRHIEGRTVAFEPNRCRTLLRPSIGVTVLGAVTAMIPRATVEGNFAAPANDGKDQAAAWRWPQSPMSRSLWPETFHWKARTT